MKQRINDLNSFYGFLSDLDQKLGSLAKEGSPTAWMQRNIHQAVLELAPARRSFADGILNRFDRLLEGDIKTGFLRGARSELDNARKDLSRYESKAPTLRSALNAVANLDAFIGMAAGTSGRCCWHQYLALKATRQTGKIFYRSRFTVHPSLFTAWSLGQSIE